MKFRAPVIVRCRSSPEPRERRPRLLHEWTVLRRRGVVSPEEALIVHSREIATTKRLAHPRPLQVRERLHDDVGLSRVLQWEQDGLMPCEQSLRRHGIATLDEPARSSEAVHAGEKRVRITPIARPPEFSALMFERDERIRCSSTMASRRKREC